MNRGLNMMGTLVPTDQLTQCFFDADSNMVASRRVYYMGMTKSGNTVMVTEHGQCWSDAPKVYKQLRLNRLGAENLFPMTPELKAGQDLVERCLETITRNAIHQQTKAITDGIKHNLGLN